MAEDVHQSAKETGTVCSVTYPIPKEKLWKHGKGFLWLTDPLGCVGMGMDSGSFQILTW
jgi:hypothetical protein